MLIIALVIIGCQASSNPEAEYDLIIDASYCTSNTVTDYHAFFLPMSYGTTVVIAKEIIDEKREKQIHYKKTWLEREQYYELKDAYYSMTEHNINNDAAMKNEINTTKLIESIFTGDREQIDDAIRKYKEQAVELEGNQYTDS